MHEAHKASKVLNGHKSGISHGSCAYIIVFKGGAALALFTLQKAARNVNTHIIIRLMPTYYELV